MRSRGAQGREPGPLRDYRETRAVGRISFEVENETTRCYRLATRNMAVEKKGEEKKNGEVAMTALIIADIKSPVGRSARHRLTDAFFFDASHGNILLVMHICRAYYLSLKT